MFLTLFGLPLQGYTLFCLIFTSIKLYQTTFSPSITKRKKSSPTGPPKPIPASQILFECLATDEGPSCNYSRFVSGDECRERISKQDRQWACVLRDGLAHCGPDRSSLRGMLDDYARRCLCKGHRKRMTNDLQSFWVGQINLWLEDINNLFHEDAEYIFQCLEEHEAEEVLDLVKAELKIIAPFLTQHKSSCVPGNFPSFPDALIRGPDNPYWLVNVQDVLTTIKERYRYRFDSLSPTRQIQQPGTFLIERASTGIDDENPDFSLYPPKEPLFEIVTKPLSSIESDPGYIYIIRSWAGNEKRDSSHVKIGYTTRSATQRTFEWSSTCGHTTEQIYCVETRNARRTEALIHTELQLRGKRRYDHRCKGLRSRCKAKHDEWFQTSEHEAKEVVSHWTSWMNHHNPYYQAGVLKSEILVTMYEPVSVGTQEDVRKLHLDFVLDSKGNPWYTPSTLTTVVEPLSRRRDDEGPALPQNTGERTMTQKQMRQSVLSFSKTGDSGQRINEVLSESGTPSKGRRSRSSKINSPFDERDRTPNSADTTSCQPQLSDAPSPTPLRIGKRGPVARNDSAPPSNDDHELRRDRSSGFNSRAQPKTPVRPTLTVDGEGRAASDSKDKYRNTLAGNNRKERRSVTAPPVMRMWKNHAGTREDPHDLTED